MELKNIFSLDGQVAIVTGASSGIGAHLAKVLAAAGASVVLAARRAEMLKQVDSEISGQSEIFRCDVTNYSELESLVEFVANSYGKVDICLNAAGITRPIAAEDEPLSEFRHVMAVNLESVFALSQLVGRKMIEAGHGSIINIASVLGLLGSGKIPQASYVASKAGVVNLTRELAAQWSSRGVRVNALAPGWFPSEMTSEMFSSQRGIDWIGRHTPIGRPGQLSELDGPTLLLASDAGSYITGETIVVDGGWSIT